MAHQVGEEVAVRDFHIDVPEEDLVDLRRRIAATQWPEKETVADESQGVPLATMQELARYWATDYDWRKVEAKLNALPQFVTEIDGLDIHFIHVRSKHDNALPLIVNHGWPGSIIEQLKIIEPLTDPTAHGGSASDAFHLVIPSMPGYGFSGKPTSTGWGPERMASAWDTTATLPRGETGGPLSSTRWACRRRRDCSPSTPICLPPFPLRSTRRCRLATPRQPVSQLRNNAPMSSWSERSSKSSTPSTWRRARKRSMALRIHPLAWPLGCSTTMMQTASRRRRSPRR